MVETIVLVVDDQPLFLQLIEKGLSPHGYTVTTFSEPQAALAALDGGLRPHLIISDINMPDMDGYDFFANVRQIAALRAVPFLFLTALGDHDSFRKGMTIGADDYITKPFSMSDLIQAVDVRLQRVQEIRTPASAALQVSGFGAPSVKRDGQRLELSSSKALECFFYFLENDQGVSAFQVAEALWPGKTESKASSSFHTTLYRLRKALGEDIVETVNRLYYISQDIAIDYDVRTYEHAVATAIEHVQHVSRSATPSSEHSLEQHGLEQHSPEQGPSQQADATLNLSKVAQWQHAARLYQPDFLATLDSPWIEEKQHVLHATQRDFLQRGIVLARDLAQQSQPFPTSTPPSVSTLPSVSAEAFAVAVELAHYLTALEPFEQAHWETLAALWQLQGEPQKARDVMADFAHFVEKELDTDEE